MGLLAGLGLALGLLLSGCASQILARQIVKAPNRGGVPRELRDIEKLAVADGVYMEAWRSPVGPPSGELAVGVVDSADYHFVYEVEVKYRRDSDDKTESVEGFGLKWNCNPKEKKPLALANTPKATLVLLHGIMMTKESMLPWAFFFAQQGYRVVLVDLRGHGRSTGRWIGFGAWEADDLVKVTDELQRRGVLVGKLGVFGQSYGAAVAIQWAARDPRVATVVALAPFSDPQAAIREFARGFNPKLAAKLSDETFATAETRAAAMAGFAWSGLNVVEAMERVRVPVLFFHGKFDTWILPAHSEALERAAPTGSRREVTPHDNHMSLMVRFDLIGPPALAWFDERLRDSAVPSSVALK